MLKSRWSRSPQLPHCLWEAAPMSLWAAQRVSSPFRRASICWKSWPCSRKASRGSKLKRWSSARWPITVRESGCSTSESQLVHQPASPASTGARNLSRPKKTTRRKRSQSVWSCKWQTWDVWARMTGIKLGLLLCKVCVLVWGFTYSHPKSTSCVPFLPLICTTTQDAFNPIRLVNTVQYFLLQISARGCSTWLFEVLLAAVLHSLPSFSSTYHFFLDLLSTSVFLTILSCDKLGTFIACYDVFTHYWPAKSSSATLTEFVFPLT